MKEKNLKFIRPGRFLPKVKPYRNSTVALPRNLTGGPHKQHKNITTVVKPVRNFTLPKRPKNHTVIKPIRNFTIPKRPHPAFKPFRNITIPKRPHPVSKPITNFTIPKQQIVNVYRVPPYGPPRPIPLNLKATGTPKQQKVNTFIYPVMPPRPVRPHGPFSI